MNFKLKAIKKMQFFLYSVDQIEEDSLYRIMVEFLDSKEVTEVDKSLSKREAEQEVARLNGGHLRKRIVFYYLEEM